MISLKRLRPKKSIQNDFYTCDTETGISKNKVIEWQLRGRPENFIFACIVGKNFRKEIHSLEELKKEFLHPRYKKRIVFFHNAEYDLNVIYGNIFTLDPKAIFNGKFICATNGNCKFADSLNIYKTSIKEIGRMLGMSKIGMAGGDYKFSNWNNKEEKIRDVNGCFRDAEIIYEALIRIFEDAGDIKITQASLSLTYFRRCHQGYDIEHNHNTVFFFDSYFGGRTEVFAKRKCYAQVIDMNSMYPYQMKTISFPDPSRLKVATNVKVSAFHKFILSQYEGCCYCTVVHKKTKFGFLPYKRDGKLLFPTGAFTGCWNFNELRFALKHKAIEIVAISKVVYAPPMKSPFISFVDDLYAKRFATDNELEIYRIKIFMNSLYGKFAQRITEETIYIENVEKEAAYIKQLQRDGLLINVQPFNSERLDAFLILKPSRPIDITFCIPSFASYITSAARVDLLKKMLDMDDCGIVYCDTDSIFYEFDNGSIKTGTEIGQWKKEAKIITEIRGLKNYRYFDFDTLKKGSSQDYYIRPLKKSLFDRIKGIPKKHKKLNENTYVYDTLIKTKEGLRRGLDAGIKITRTKKISGLYEKRIVMTDGSTEPFFIEP